MGFEKPNMDAVTEFPSGKLTGAIIGAAMEVHSALGPGLLESAYESCLFFELAERGIQVDRQVALPVEYKKRQVDCGFRIDLLVESEVIVELKAVEKTLPIHTAQLMTYLKLSGKRVGLIINFNVASLRDGIIRRII